MNGTPKDFGGSYTPQEAEAGVKPRKFIMKEKIRDMMAYSLPILKTFPRRDKELADMLKEEVLTAFRLAVRLERRYHKKTTLEDLDIELSVIKELVVVASDKAYSGEKYAPPLTIHQREVWSRYNDEIGKIIGGYKKALEQNNQTAVNPSQ